MTVVLTLTTQFLYRGLSEKAMTLGRLATSDAGQIDGNEMERNSPLSYGRERRIGCWRPSGRSLARAREWSASRPGCPDEDDVARTVECIGGELTDEER